MSIYLRGIAVLGAMLMPASKKKALGGNQAERQTFQVLKTWKV